MANQPKKYKKFVATAATATLVASAIVPVASAAGFKDVANNTHAEAINALADQKVINGYPDGTFKPNKDLTRSDVVKLLGKYLVSKGYEIPADAKTAQRFNDVPVDYKDQELVEYAALVKDAGVFKGSNNNLNAANKITRGQMALVVVRALDELNGLDLVNFVEGQDFDKEVIDLNAASKEQQGAINVLDYFDITKTAKFNPSNTTTRGQFASFLYRAINTDFSDVTDVAVQSVAAINNTTVEVTFKDTVENLSSLDFTIEGLEVKNAALKQGNDKVVVLTTAAQEAGKEYTVKLGDSKIGKFKGISAVIPTAVNVVEQSLQAPLGQQVTVKAQVTVAEGQSKAGIPVTFNIVNSVTKKSNVNANALNQPIVAEAYTDENGVATYTYTRYASTTYQLTTEDEVQAYATGNPTARSFGKVYWASIQPLTITEVTAGNSINNGGKKVYKIKLAGAQRGNDVVNVGYRENVNVTPDKAVKDVTVTDSNGVNLGYPGQFTTSSKDVTNNRVVQIKLDKNGEATFTLTGSNATVTPFVFVDFKSKTQSPNTDPTIGRFDSTELFAQAPSVTFAKSQNLGLTLEAEGTGNAAAFKKGLAPAVDADSKLVANVGGRTYKATLTNADGKTAQSGTPVYLHVKYGSSDKADSNANVWVYDINAKKLIKLTYDEKNGSTAVTLLTDSKGQVAFKLIGEKNSYATPTVFVETGDKVGLDDNDLKQTGEISYFGNEVISAAKLLVNDKETTSSVVSEEAEFLYQTVDQNGNPYTSSSNFVVTFEVTTTFNTANVSVGKGTAYAGFENGGLVNVGSTKSFTVKSTDQATASIKVKAGNNTQVTVKANASHNTFADLTASVTFTKLNEEGIEAGQSVTGRVVAIDTTNKKIALSDSKGEKVYELSYKDAVLNTVGNNVSEATFIANLTLGEELKFTQATDTTKAIFNDTNVNSGVAIKAKSVNSVDFGLTATYDFNGGTYTAPKFNVTGKKVTLKNVTIKGDLYITADNEDLTLDNVVVEGNVYVNGGDGDTLVLNNTQITGTLNVNHPEHIVFNGNSSVPTVNVNESNVRIDGDSTSTIGNLVVAQDVNKPAVGGVTVEKEDGKPTVDNTAPEITSAAYTVNGGAEQTLQLVDGGYTVAAPALKNTGSLKVTIAETSSVKVTSTDTKVAAEIEKAGLNNPKAATNGVVTIDLADLAVDFSDQNAGSTKTVELELVDASGNKTPLKITVNVLEPTIAELEAVGAIEVKSSLIAGNTTVKILDKTKLPAYLQTATAIEVVSGDVSETFVTQGETTLAEVPVEVAEAKNGYIRVVAQQ